MVQDSLEYFRMVHYKWGWFGIGWDGSRWKWVRLGWDCVGFRVIHRGVWDGLLDGVGGL